MSGHEAEILSTLKDILDELVAYRKEREAIRQAEEESAENFRKQLAAEREARRREHEAYLATVQSAPCEVPPLLSHQYHG